LASLGFIEILDDEHLRLRSPLLRFADPVRGLSDINAALERLIARGEIVELDLDDGATENDGREEGPDEDEDNGAGEAEDDEEPEA
jgi:chromosome partition protein MukE